MASSSGTKLFKVASSINIGRDAIVDYLVSKGFSIENKATAVLTDEMVDLVEEKFSKEIKHAEKQREKVERQRQVRKNMMDQGSAVSIEPQGELPPQGEQYAAPAEVVAPEAAAPVEPPVPAIEHVSAADAGASVDAPAPTASPVDVNADVEQGGAVVAEEKSGESDAASENAPSGPAVGTVIDLGGYRKGSQPQPKPVKEQPSAPKPAEPVAERTVEQPAAPVVEAAVEPVAKVEPVVETPAPVAQVPETAPVPPAPESPAPVKPADAAAPAAAAPSGQAPEAAAAAESDDARQKKKRKRVIEVEYKPGQGVQLKGLTVLGKIDLAPKPEPRPKREREKGPGERGGGNSGKATIGDAIGKDGRSAVGASNNTGSTGPRFGPPKKPGGGVPKKDDKKKRKTGAKSTREQFSDSDVERAIRQTLAGIEVAAGSTSSRRNARQRRRMEREEKEAIRQEELARESTILRLSEFVTTADLANLMRVSASDIILKCMSLGLMVSINQRLDKDTITLIADDYGFQVEFLDDKSMQEVEEDEDDPETLRPRPPIVTIMGHVDHGKTSLLDYIRNANVVAGEAGGITQHIGAYRVELPDQRSITFLDTPGHEAFTAMRARGAQVTDIVVLVVAADDSVMPQTIEAISHAQAANVPIVVAINKIDRPDANPDRIKQQLADHGVLVEDWGGKYQAVQLSAKSGLNVDQLLEKILLEADILELKANPDRAARGTVIEAHVDKGRGNVVTVIVQKGTLNVGDIFVCGQFAGRVRALTDERGNKVESAGPAFPVQVTGFDGLPFAGDILVEMETDAEAREVATRRQQLRREQQLKGMRHMTLDDISAQISAGGVKELRLIVRADVSGSVEALSDSLQKLSTNEVKVRILFKSVGAITESDIMLASASDAVIVGFQVNVPPAARKLAEAESVDVRLYSIIYDCINEVQLALEGMLTPDIKEETTGTVEVRATFKISKLGTIAGCYVTSGKITRNDRIRVLRDGFEIFKGTLASLKRVKDDVREVDTGYECGIGVNGFNDIEEGDMIEAYKTVEIKRKLA